MPPDKLTIKSIYFRVFFAVCPFVVGCFKISPVVAFLVVGVYFFGLRSFRGSVGLVLRCLWSVVGSSDALRVYCGPFPFSVDRWQLFRFAGFGRMLCGLAWRRISSAMGFYFALWVLLRLWSFFRSVGLWMLCRFWAWFPCMSSGGFWAWLWCVFSAVFVRCRFGYNLPVVFSASFWDPLRLLLFSWFYIPGGGCRSRCRSPRRL